MKTIILGAGCNWCSEALFKSLNGVINLRSGYYSLVNTIYALNKKDKVEVIYFDYDETILPTEVLLDFFFNVHNPTLISWNEDSFYPLGRSALFYFNEEDKKIFDNYIEKIKPNSTDTIYTKVLPAKVIEFTLTEEKYRDYYTKYPDEAFSKSNIAPKIKMIQNNFKKLLK